MRTKPSRIHEELGLSTARTEDVETRWRVQRPHEGRRRRPGVTRDSTTRKRDSDRGLRDGLLFKNTLWWYQTRDPPWSFSSNNCQKLWTEYQVPVWQSITFSCAYIACLLCLLACPIFTIVAFFGRFPMLLLLTFAVAHGNLSPAQRLEICQEHGLLIRNRCTWRRSKDLTVTVSYLVTRFLGFRLRVSGDKGMSLSVWVSLDTQALDSC